MNIILHDNNILYVHFENGYRILSDFELLDLYNLNPELAKQDIRLNDLLNPIEPEPTEQEIITAEILLNQADILAKQNEQDEVLAEILLNQMGV